MCPQCGFIMSAFDKECLRCHGKGIAPTSPPQSAPVSPSPALPVQVVSGDEPSFLFAMLGFFTPFFFFVPGLIIGAIVYFILRNSAPAKASSYGKGLLLCLGLIGIIAAIVFMALVFLGGPVENTFNAASESLNTTPP